LFCSPDRRLSAAQALAHPYFAGLHDPADEPVFPEPLSANPELDDMSVNAVKAAVMQEIFTFNPDLQYIY